MALLTRDGDIWTCGNSEQGQLGRVPEKFGHRGGGQWAHLALITGVVTVCVPGRRGGQLLLQADRIHSKSKSKKFRGVWAGSYNTLALTTAGEVLVMGLNNYSQMGIDHNKAGLTFFMPVKSDDLSKRWVTGVQIILIQKYLSSETKNICMVVSGRSWP